MKKFEITFVKYGNCANYNKRYVVEATSAKMALKKFYNHKEFGDSRTMKKWMEYEEEMNGIHYSAPIVKEI